MRHVAINANMLRFLGIIWLSLSGLHPVAAEEIDFAHDIQPLLNKRCAKCHSGPQRKGGFSINTRQSLLVGGESGRVVIPGKSGSSELIKRVSAADAGERMPPEGEPLTKSQIDSLRRWIDADLPWEDGFDERFRTDQPVLDLG